MPALGLSAKKMPPLIIRKMCASHQEANYCFPSRQGKKWLWLLALAVLTTQTLTNLSGTGLAEKSYFFVVKITENESFSKTRAFSVVEMQVIPAAEWAKPREKARIN